MENYLIPGFRFYPTEEELVSFYLNTKLEDGRHDLKQEMDQIIPILDIYDFNPWDLPRYAGEVCKRDKEQWFFFIARQESEARGGRPKRLTTTGYWKATGSPSHVYSSTHKTIGLKKTMVFYNGRAPHGTKTEWKMNEYKAIHPSSSSSATPVFRLRQEFSLCRIYRKSKTLRSFDRRPQPRELEIAQSAAKAQAATAELPSVVNEPNPTPKAPLTGIMLAESSRTIAETSNELNVEAMRDACEPMWDWELLNWF